MKVFAFVYELLLSLSQCTLFSRSQSCAQDDQQWQDTLTKLPIVFEACGKTQGVCEWNIEHARHPPKRCVEAFEKVIANKRESILLQLGGCGIAFFMDDVSERNYPEDEDFWL